MYFVRVMLVLSDPVCVLFSGMLHVYKSDVSVAVLITPKTTAFGDRLKIVELFGSVLLKSKAEGNISFNYRFHIVTRFKSYLQITNVNFFQNSAVKRKGCVLNLPSHKHIYIARYLFSVRDE